MSTTTAAPITIQPPSAPLPDRYIDAYNELTAIQRKLATVKPNEMPDIDEIGPLLQRARALGDFLEARIAAAEKLNQREPTEG